MRLIQHKKEAYWFYRFLSTGYDRWVNPLFWTPAMRTEALRGAQLDERRLEVLDAGAGTGFTTEGIVEAVDADRVTMLDQSPHQLARAERKPALARVRKLQGDAEALPLETDRFDRYVSAGSIEYWPAPERGIAEAYRVLKPGGIALIAGPVPPGDRFLRWLAELWMLFPTEAQYREWFERAGFEDVELTAVAPDWYRDPRSRYAVAVSGRKPAAGASPLAPAGAVEDVTRADGLAAPPHVRRALRARLARGPRVRAGRCRALAAPPRDDRPRGRHPGGTSARGAVALLAPAHDHRHDGQHRRALPDRRGHASPGSRVGGGLWDLWWTLVAGLAVNVYIVGVNQLEDVDIDRVNKPFLPLASGEMTQEYARAVVAASAGLAVVLAVSQGAEETVAVLAGLVVGTAYSTPPLRLKRYPVAASLCISGVRSIVVNLGVYAHFSLALAKGRCRSPRPSGR